MRVAIVHDYLTQRGGAERVVLSMAAAFPGAPIYTSLYEPAGTFPEFAELDVRPSLLNRVRPIRRHHRVGLPLYAPLFSTMRIDADVVICSSSGWAHGVRTTGRKVVYCHTPARWLYQTERYVGLGVSAGDLAMRLMARPLRRWDRRAASSADVYLANSSAVAHRIAQLYGVQAPIVPPPHRVDATGEQEPVAGLEPGFVLSIGRLLPYKNVAATVAAVRGLDGYLVVCGDGPERARLEASAPENVRFLGTRTDAELRWLYANCAAVVSASHEDFGLTPVEGAAFGAPSIVLRWGGFVDTVVEGRTGVFFETTDPAAVRAATEEALRQEWDKALITAHADQFSEAAFIAALRESALA